MIFISELFPKAILENPNKPQKNTNNNTSDSKVDNV